jgi:hypothetical protein
MRVETNGIYRRGERRRKMQDMEALIEHEHKHEHEMEQALGAFICEQNPYTEFPGEEGPPQKPKTGEMTLGPKWQVVDSAVQNGEYALLWDFDGKPRRVRKAIRIKYTYKATYKMPSGEEIERDEIEHLLLGYEGSGDA